MDAKFPVGVIYHPAISSLEQSRRSYTTKEGETAYAVDMEGHGTLRLCSEHTIVAHNR